MTNVETKVEGKILVIRVDLSKEFGYSKTGKSITVATTSGFRPVPSNGEASDIAFSLNVNKKSR